MTLGGGTHQKGPGPYDEVKRTHRHTVQALMNAACVLQRPQQGRAAAPRRQSRAGSRLASGGAPHHGSTAAAIAPYGDSARGIGPLPIGAQLRIC